VNKINQAAAIAAFAALLAVSACGQSSPAQTPTEIRSAAAEGAKAEAESRMDATYNREQTAKHELERAENVAAQAEAERTADAGASADGRTTRGRPSKECESESADPRTSCNR
jgi:ABC-type glycerol-3-phosphate transport system substrate-binding protein